MKKYKTIIVTAVITAFLTYFILLVLVSSVYGRLTDHLHCDRSIDNMETLKD